MGYDDLLAHSVSADCGLVGAATEDGAVPCVRLVFHHGHEGEQVVHSERFIAPEAVIGLILELVAVNTLQAGDAPAELPAGAFKRLVMEAADGEVNGFDHPFISFALGAMAATLDAIAEGEEPGLEVLAGTFEDLLHGELGEQILRAVGEHRQRTQ